MKTAKPPATENGGGGSSSSRRAQPVRQTRINPPRNSSLNRGNSFNDTPAQEKPIDIFPGVNNFTDAISALPKEIVRHFTLLKEVDAKIFHNEGKLFTNLRNALDTPPPAGLFPSFDDASTTTAPTSAPMSVQGSSTGAPPNLAPLSVPSNADSTDLAYSQANLPRRQLFRETSLRLQDMMLALEEKNHVLLTANDALEKQMKRIDTVWPHLESEFSEEAKWGSTTHWAYFENRQAQQQAKTNDKQAERTRREGAATLSAAAEKLAEELAARSSDRKQAIAAKKNAKTQSGEGDADKANEPTKKTHAKSRKAPAEPAAPIGLGITTGTPVAPAPSKRRKVDPAKTNGATPAERAMSTVFGNSTAKPKTTSPRETPVPESGPKKRKALPTSSGQAKKSRTNAANSPSVASSPVIGTFPDPAKANRASPVPLPTAAPPRPVSSRARQNSTQSSAESTRQRRSSVASSKPNGITPDTPDPNQQSNGTKTNPEPKVQKETPIPAPTIAEPIKMETEIPPPAIEPPPSNGNNTKENPTKAVAAATSAAAAEASSTAAEEAKAKEAEETEEKAPEKEPTPPAPEPTPPPAATITEEHREPPKKESVPPAIQPPPPTTNVVKTKSGRASKPSTPAIATFAEAASTTSGTTTRSRPTRNNSDAVASQNSNNGGSTTTTTTTTSKRSHKKGASMSASAASIAAQQAAAAAAAKENSSTSGKNSHHKGEPEDDDDEEDEDEANEEEPRYCKCNGISYGEMVACDGANCQKEWFHLECVGLKVAPKGNAKWYCDECKERLKKR
ncbi:putative transcriptional regulatory protein [Podospora australis]|uniref:Chromatin modification-related protein n=1 Tax=Podospora australis TaxID=1536484 RepID=A0AAN7AIT0_9PEZI|nr:putative transcriptional regulatory protein [Podospora australis]